MNHHPQSNQPRFAAAYYAPPIYAYQPPYPPPPPHNNSRRLLKISIRFFIAFCIAFGLAILILYLVFRPQKIQISVSSASLNRFNLTSFNLSVNLVFRNPNRRFGIYYDWLQASAEYGGARLGRTALPVFYQGRKEATEVAAKFEGDKLGFERENAAGVFRVDLWILARVRYKLGGTVTRRYAMRAVCPMKLRFGEGGFTDFVDCRVLNP